MTITVNLPPREGEGISDINDALAAALVDIAESAVSEVDDAVTAASTGPSGRLFLAIDAGIDDAVVAIEAQEADSIAAVEAVIADFDASSPALAHWQKLLSKLDNAIEDASVVLVGDSTGDATTEWYYLLGAAMAAVYPAWTFKHAAWNTGTVAYDSPTTIATGSGSRICTFYNGSVAGSSASYHAGDNFTAAMVTPAPDLILISYGHNGSTTGTRQLDFFDALASRLKTEMPETPVIQIGQNPTLSDETMAAKIAVLAPFAARNGWGFISVHDAFKQAGVALATLLADSVHPNATGSALWCATVLASLRASRAAYGGGSIAPSVLLASWAHPSEFDEWTKANVTLTTDTTNYETLGKSASLACTTAGVAYIYKTIVTGEDIVALRGKWVTFWVVQRVPVGNDGSSGRIDLVDAGGTTTAVGVQQGTGFILFSARKKIDAGATSLVAYLYPCATAGVSNTIQIDRGGLALGLSPIDMLPRWAQFATSIRIMGGAASGIGVLYNSNSTASGLRTIATATADPSSAWTSDFSSDGFAVKAAGNTVTTYSLTASGLQMGPGTGALDIVLDRQASGVMRLSGADFWPDNDGTRYLGWTTKQWRALLVKDGVYVNGVLVIKTQGAAIPALTVTATSGTLPTANGSVTIADAAAPTVVELLEYCRELEAKLEAALARMRAATGHGLIA